MVTYGVETKWKINVKVGDKLHFYTGVIVEEDENSIKFSTIKDEVRIISKIDIVSAKEYARFDHGKTEY